MERRIGRTPYWKVAVAMLAAGWVVIWISRMMLTPIYPVLSEFFGGVSHAQLGAISSFYFLGYVLVQIPSGLLVDRFGARRVAVPGFVVFAAGAALIACSRTIEQLYAASVVTGLGCGTFFGVAYSLTNTCVPAGARSVATAVVNSGTAVGSGLGLVSASCLVSTGLMHWQVLAAVTGLLAAVMVAVFWFGLRGARQRAAALRAEEKWIAATYGRGEEGKARGLARFFEPHMVAAYVLYFATLYAYYLISTWLPDFLGRERAFPDTLTGIVTALVFLAGIPGGIVFGHLADRLPKRRISLIACLEVCAAIMLLVMVQARSHVVIICAIVGYGMLGKLAVEPMLIAWLGDHAPASGMGTTFGVFNFFGMSASVVAPELSGLLTDSLGSGTIGFEVAAGVLVAGMVVFVLVNRACERRAEARATATRQAA